ncbi:uncharacterized protein LOC134166589 [Pezoporus occidentalis]|uniref:uncharacterized protein LOC134166589 n=1 Tax=Pezoporus occidentalis TaxID=407982 RepID=UPI002F908885
MPLPLLPVDSQPFLCPYGAPQILFLSATEAMAVNHSKATPGPPASHSPAIPSHGCREEPLGWEPTAPAGKPAHGSKRNREGALLGSAMPARAGDSDAATGGTVVAGHLQPKRLVMGSREAAAQHSQGKRGPSRLRCKEPCDAARLHRELPPPGQAVTGGGMCSAGCRGGSRAVAPCPRSPAAVTRCPAPAHPGLGPPRPSTY